MKCQAELNHRLLLPLSLLLAHSKPAPDVVLGLLLLDKDSVDEVAGLDPPRIRASGSLAQTDILRSLRHLSVFGYHQNPKAMLVPPASPFVSSEFAFT